MTSVRIQDSIDPIIDEWESLAQRTKAIPFLWPGWIAAWWSTFGVGRLQILTAYEDDRLVALLPLCRRRGRLDSPANSETPLFGFLAEDEGVVKQLSHTLFSQRIRSIDLAFLAPADVGVSSVLAAAGAAGYRVLTESIEAAPYVTIDGDWEAFEKGLGRNLRKDLRRRRRRLDEEGRLALEVSHGEERLDALLEEGFRVEGSGWKGAYGTSIGSQPQTRRFYTEVAHWAAERGWLRLAFLRLDGRALAFDYCLEHERTHYVLKTGYDPAYERFSPGKVLRHMMLARAFSEGLATYDFLGVGSDYTTWKRAWTDTVQERLFLHMFAPTAIGLLDRAVFVTNRAALENAKRFARSSVVGGRGRRLLKRTHAAVNARLGR